MTPMRLACQLADLPIEVLGRLRSDRVLHFPVPARQPGPLAVVLRPHPCRGELPQWHLAAIGVKPVTRQDFGFLADEPGSRVPLAGERLGAGRSKPSGAL
jgi:hypothetical protein